MLIFTKSVLWNVKEKAYSACPTLVAKENTTPSCVRDTGRRSYNKEKEVTEGTKKRHGSEGEFGYVNITVRIKARKYIWTEHSRNI